MQNKKTAMIDLRSDTVTKPTPAMRRAMASAEVGDDVFGDDPTVRALEEETAGLLGKESAMFAPSGTMANEIAIRAHTEPGDEIIIEANAHIYYYEAGGPAALAGVMCRCIEGKRGLFTSDDVEAVIRPADQHFAVTRLVCVENTHNRGGGCIWPLQQIQSVCKTARKYKLGAHMDGARLWNACVATGVSEKKYSEPFDTVSVCFSKGLGAPIGSVLVGPKAFIQRARRFRKMFGGGMRQVGIIAAGALYALKHHRERLAEDHANARLLADGLLGVEGIEIHPDEVETNMVRFRVKKMTAMALVEKLNARGVWVLPVGPDRIRAVTSLMVSRRDILKAIEIIKKTVIKG